MEAHLTTAPRQFLSTPPGHVPSAALPRLRALEEAEPALLIGQSPGAIRRASNSEFLQRVSALFKQLAWQDATEPQTWWDGCFEHRWARKTDDFLFTEAFLRVRYPLMSSLVRHVRAMDRQLPEDQPMTSGYFRPPATGWLKSAATVAVAGGPQHTAVHYAWALGHEMLVHAVQQARKRPEWIRHWDPLLPVSSFREYWNLPYERLARQGAATATRALTGCLVRFRNEPELLPSLVAARPAAAASRAIESLERSVSDIEAVLRSSEQRASACASSKNPDGIRLPGAFLAAADGSGAWARKAGSRFIYEGDVSK